MELSIKTGDRVKIQLAKDGANITEHASQVENVLPDGRIVVHAPISMGKLVKLPENTIYKFLFFTERGIVRYDGIVEEYANDSGFAVMVVKLYSSGERIQRRDFFRFACVLPMKFSVLEEHMEAGKKTEAYQAIVKDIGGGGIKFLSNADIKENISIKCIVKLNEDYLVAVGDILEKFYFPKSNYRYQYRVGFTQILPSEQEKIVQYIFNEQKKNLQRINPASR